MSKQQEIEEGMVAFTEREILYWRVGSPKPKQLVKALLYYQQSQGVRLKCDRALPNEVYCPDGTLAWVEDII